MCKHYVVFYENCNTGFIGVVGFADTVIECEHLVNVHYSDSRTTYVYHIVPNFPNVLHKFNTSVDFVNIRSIFDKLLIIQCYNVANWLCFADLALKKNHFKNSLRNHMRALDISSDTSILDNYEVC